MALMTRVARLFRADLHAVLDRIEEPEALLRQALREMEDALGEDRRRLALLSNEVTSIAVRTRDLRDALDDVAGKLDVCFDAGNDELARALIKRRLETERLLGAAERRRVALDADRAALARRVEDNEARLEAMRQKADILGEQHAVRGEDDLAPAGVPAVTEHDVEIALLREKQSRSRP